MVVPIRKFDRRTRAEDITTGETTSTVISTQTTIENSGFGLNTVFFTNGGAGYRSAT